MHIIGERSRYVCSPSNPKNLTLARLVYSQPGLYEENLKIDQLKTDHELHFLLVRDTPYCLNLRGNMTQSAIELVEEFYRRMSNNDFQAAAELLSEDYFLEWPQSKERIRGWANFVAVNVEYPASGPWCFTINRIFGNDTDVVTDVSITDGTQAAHAITFHTVQAGRITRQVEFWPENYPAPENRKHLVERMD